MVDVSVESPEQTDARLRRVVATATLDVFDVPYAFEEVPAASGDPRDDAALALVRDGEVWSRLVPAGDAAPEPFGLVCFHFPPGVDNSGFVGWLASHLKRVLGTGVFVVCGQSSGRGGIFDYWGFPLELRDEVLGEIRRLRGDAG